MKVYSVFINDGHGDPSFALFAIRAAALAHAEDQARELFPDGFDTNQAGDLVEFADPDLSSHDGGSSISVETVEVRP
jgi:hypothetical protein